MTTRSLEKLNDAPVSSGFYTAADVARLARVSPWQLRSWERKGVIGPDVEVTEDQGPIYYGYSFEYLVYIGLLRQLLDRGHTLERSVRGLKHLRDRFGPPGPKWFDVRLAMERSNLVAFKDDEWGATVATMGGQKLAAPIVAIDFTQIGGRLDALLIPERFQAHIEMNPEVRSGMPIIRGTRIRTNLISRLSQKGESIAEIRRAYPVLTKEQIISAIDYERTIDTGR